MFQYCKVQCKVVPKDQVIREDKPKQINWELFEKREGVKRGLYRRDPATGEIVHVSEIKRIVNAEAAHGFINDEMPPTLHPKDGKYYTSKAKFRAATAAHGCVEVGDAYDRGYDPAKEAAKERQALIDKQWDEFSSRVYRR